MGYGPFVAAVLATLPLAAAAKTPMTGAEFEAFVTGKTMTYAEYGSIYGTEDYLPGRRVRWAFTEDVCRFGTWYEDSGNICFLYEGDPQPKCWTVWQDGDRLAARYIDNPPDDEPSVVEETDEPLACEGPDVGV